MSGASSVIRPPGSGEGIIDLAGEAAVGAQDGDVMSVDGDAIGVPDSVVVDRHPAPPLTAAARLGASRFANRATRASYVDRRDLSKLKFIELVDRSIRGFKVFGELHRRVVRFSPDRMDIVRDVRAVLDASEEFSAIAVNLLISRYRMTGDPFILLFLLEAAHTYREPKAARIYSRIADSVLLGKEVALPGLVAEARKNYYALFHGLKSLADKGYTPAADAMRELATDTYEGLAVQDGPSGANAAKALGLLHARGNKEALPALIRAALHEGACHVLQELSQMDDAYNAVVLSSADDPTKFDLLVRMLSCLASGGEFYGTWPKMFDVWPAVRRVASRHPAQVARVAATLATVFPKTYLSEVTETLTELAGVDYTALNAYLDLIKSLGARSAAELARAASRVDVRHWGRRAENRREVDSQEPVLALHFLAEAGSLQARRALSQAMRKNRKYVSVQTAMSALRN